MQHWINVVTLQKLIETLPQQRRSNKTVCDISFGADLFFGQAVYKSVLRIFNYNLAHYKIKNWTMVLLFCKPNKKKKFFSYLLNHVRTLDVIFVKVFVHIHGQHRNVTEILKLYAARGDQKEQVVSDNRNSFRLEWLETLWTLQNHFNTPKGATELSKNKLKTKR